MGARAPTDGGPRKSTNGLETEGGAMPRGEMAGAVEVNGREHGASRGGASRTTPELDCGMDVGGTGTADTYCGTGTSRLDPGTLDAERENGLGCGGAAGRECTTTPLVERDCGRWSRRSGTPDTAPENGLGCAGTSGRGTATGVRLAVGADHH